MSEAAWVSHPFKPIFTSKSKILILGSFPSRISRAESFYYANIHNRFWPLMSDIFGLPCANDRVMRTHLIISEHLALWDVIGRCRIINSSDASISDVAANDIASLIAKTEIRTVICNGRKAYDLYEKLSASETGLHALCFPSTSPANAAWTYVRLREKYGEIRRMLSGL